MTKAKRPTYAWYKINWKPRIDGKRKERRCVIRADNMSMAVAFARRHYGDNGPGGDYQVGPISESQARRLRCDKLDANQLSLV